MNRAADILLSFSFDRPSLSLGEIADSAKVPKPTAYRLLSSLRSRGLVRQAPDGRYEPGFRLFELGEIAQSRLTLPMIAAEAMDELVRETGETALLAQADWNTLEVLVLDRRAGSHPLLVRGPEGRRPLIPPDPQGKALLAALPSAEVQRVMSAYAARGPEERLLVESGQIQRAIQETRARGYSIDEQEYAVGVSGVGAWIVLGDRGSVASLAVLAPSDRLSGGRIARVGERARALAAQLSYTRGGERATSIGRLKGRR